MEQRIREEIRRFVLESEENRFPGSGERYFDEPLVGYAAAGAAGAQLHLADQQLVEQRRVEVGIGFGRWPLRERRGAHAQRGRGECAQHGARQGVAVGPRGS